MIECNNIISIGLPLVDQKAIMGRTPGLVEAHPGGVTPNILSTFLRLSVTRNIKFFSKVGNDANGQFYLQKSPELGQIQIEDGGLTGVYLRTIDSEGEIVEINTKYNSASDFEVKDSDLETSGPVLFISDLFTLQLTKREREVRKVFEKIRSQGGVFALSLSGIQNLTVSVLDFFSRFNFHPNIVFGNRFEMSFVSKDLKANLPQSFLTVMTMGELGSKIELNQQILYLPAYKQYPDIVDESGAGDCYMGTMLAILVRLLPENLSMEKIVEAGKIASIAAGLVVTNKESRLSNEQIKNISELINKKF